MTNTSLVPDARGIVVIRVRRHDSFRTSISLDETIVRLALCIWKSQRAFEDWLCAAVRQLDSQLLACETAGQLPVRKSGFSRRVTQMILAEAIARIAGAPEHAHGNAAALRAAQLELPGLLSPSQEQ